MSSFSDCDNQLCPFWDDGVVLNCSDPCFNDDTLNCPDYLESLSILKNTNKQTQPEKEK